MANITGLPDYVGKRVPLAHCQPLSNAKQVSVKDKGLANSVFAKAVWANLRAIQSVYSVTPLCSKCGEQLDSLLFYPQGLGV